MMRSGADYNTYIRDDDDPYTDLIGRRPYFDERGGLIDDQTARHYAW